MGAPEVLMEGVVFGESPRWHDDLHGCRRRRLVRDVANRHCVRIREGGEVLATVDLDRGAFSGALSREDDPRLFVVGQTWGGPDPRQPSGRVVAFPAPAPGAGKP